MENDDSVHMVRCWRVSSSRLLGATIVSFAAAGLIGACNVSSEGKYRFGAAGAGNSATGGQGGSSGSRTGGNADAGSRLEPIGAYSNGGSAEPPPGSGGSIGGGAGAGEEGGSPATEELGGAGGASAVDEPMGSGGTTAAVDLSGVSAGAPPTPSCQAEKAVRCVGEGQAERETCEAGEWIETEGCSDGQSCDTATNACRAMAAECVGRNPAESYCEENRLVECSADTFSGKVTACDGQCVQGGGTANCVAASCGDAIQQDGETCDDGNKTGGDGCSPACQLEPVALASGGLQSCAISSRGTLRCWGDNANGELGLGDKQARGALPSDLGANLPGADLGAHTVKSVSTGMSHTCAILDDDTLRCWGLNSSGRLGHGDSVSRGDDEGEMGDALPATSLGGMGKLSMVAAGDGHSCGLLSGGRVKCWGQNNYGQLGAGDTNVWGDATTELGDALPAVDLGPGRTAKYIAVGTTHSCAVLDSNNVKCWGNNARGQLGQGDKDPRGDEAAELSKMVFIDLGGIPATQVAAGDAHSCALLSDGAVKCWGGNDLGQLGLGDTNDRGDAPNEMGAALPAVPLGRAAVAISSGFNHTCALLDDKSVKCWGGNGLGQLGQGDTNHRGDAPNELGTLQPVKLGTGRTVSAVSAGRTHNCALLDDRSIRCWGFNAAGQLGTGNTKSYGNASGTMGDALIPVNLRF